MADVVKGSGRKIERRRMNHMFSVRATPEDFDLLCAAAEGLGITVSAFIRRSALTNARHAARPDCALTSPRRFVLRRTYDESGVSGTGDVAWGVLFPDGHCVLRWASEHRSTACYSSLADLVAIHGHNGNTEVVWIDPLDELADQP